ncbi:MAG: insulinase family protein [Stomatobaculum sp.]|nr:insulinase family protein [Stomatobaculum sp.]
MEELKGLGAYQFLTETEIPEIRATGVTMEHRKTGAKVFLLLCSDNNKVFTIGFRTPSRDSTGVAHIVEHTVLCGSEKYPSKDPFVELVKGSLNTFLNAMTYPDKTIYPVASCNDTDFRNLMDVYLDAVFHPNLYREEKIFRQEGWHYEMDSADGELRLNGVVYNEMKGAYSSLDGRMEQAIGQALFPGHPYAEDSGGDPDIIPELTYEDYLAFHSRYYHPSNSYIYLYGNTDMAEQLRYIDETYLSSYERREPDSGIPVPAKLENYVEEVCEYPLSESESPENAVSFSFNTRVGGELDPVRYNAFQALAYVLMEVPGAPLHEAVINAGLGEDVYGGYANGIREPYFTITVKNSSFEKKEDCRRVITETLKELSEGALDHEMLKAAINAAEFRAREADFGSYPKGLMYGIECFNSWLYDEDPCMHLKFDELFRELYRKVDENFFESLIREALLENRNGALIIMKPVPGQAGKRDLELKEQLSAKASSLSEEERERLVRETKELKTYQSEPSSPEDLRKIPLLKRSDITRQAEKIIFAEREEDGVKVIWSDVFTSGIAYLRLLFDCTFLKEEDYPYLALLKDSLGYIDTEQHSYAELSTLINRCSGGISFGMDSYADYSGDCQVRFVFTGFGKVLHDKIPFALETMREMLLETKLSDRERLKDIAAEVKAGLKDRLTASGHSAALVRAGSCLFRSSQFSDATKGIVYYRLLERLCADFDAKAEKTIAKLKELVEKIFTAGNLTVHLTADAEGYEAFCKAFRGYRAGWPETERQESAEEFVPCVRREAWTSASLVNYVARIGNFRAHGFRYTGALRILKVLLSYDYLWNNIRVKGGAYGCSAAFGRAGTAGFVSYRDPKILETDKVYEGIADYVSQFDADEREMTKFIIGAVSELDIPLTPQGKGSRGLAAWYSHVTDEEIQLEREEILDAVPEDIRALAPLLRAVLSDGVKCVIGNEAQIREAAEAFTDVTPLFSA